MLPHDSFSSRMTDFAHCFAHCPPMKLGPAVFYPKNIPFVVNSGVTFLLLIKANEETNRWKKIKVLSGLRMNVGVVAVLTTHHAV